MFTGIIEEVGLIKNLSPIGPHQYELSVYCSTLQDDMKLGDSVAVNGVCLTVIRYNAENVVFELSAETMKYSTFGKLPKRAEVNLERALALKDRLGGHIVQGHIDGSGKLTDVSSSGEFYDLSFTFPDALEKYIVSKGSIAINGISLTIASLKANTFQVAVIPHTYKNTNLQTLNPGDLVHLESDILGRYIEHMLKFQEKNEKKSKITPEFLKKYGF